MDLKSAYDKFRGSGFYRNWFYPVLGGIAAAVGSAAYQMYQACDTLILGVLPDVACFDEVELASVVLSTGFGIIATKFKALAGKDQPWFDHEPKE